MGGVRLVSFGKDAAPGLLKMEEERGNGRKKPGVWPRNSGGSGRDCANNNHQKPFLGFCVGVNEFSWKNKTVEGLVDFCWLNCLFGAVSI